MRTKDNGVSVKSIAGATESSVARERSGVDRRGPRWLGLIRDDLFTEALCLPSTSGLETLNCDVRRMSTENPHQSVFGERSVICFEIEALTRTSKNE